MKNGVLESAHTSSKRLNCSVSRSPQSVIKHKPPLAYICKGNKDMDFITLIILCFATFHSLEVIFRYFVGPCVGKTSQNCILRCHTGNLKSAAVYLCYDIQLTLKIKAFSPLESQLLYFASTVLKKIFLFHKK